MPRRPIHGLYAVQEDKLISHCLDAFVCIAFIRTLEKQDLGTSLCYYYRLTQIDSVFCLFLYCLDHMHVLESPMWLQSSVYQCSLRQCEMPSVCVNVKLETSINGNVSRFRDNAIATNNTLGRNLRQLMVYLTPHLPPLAAARNSKIYPDYLTHTCQSINCSQNDAKLSDCLHIWNSRHSALHLQISTSQRFRNCEAYICQLSLHTQMQQSLWLLFPYGEE